jgi:hypothetical protein
MLLALGPLGPAQVQAAAAVVVKVEGEVGLATRRDLGRQPALERRILRGMLRIGGLVPIAVQILAQQLAIGRMQTL